MTTPRRWSTLVLMMGALALAGLTACTRSLEMRYNPSL
jgi:hypothetical protein